MESTDSDNKQLHQEFLDDFKQLLQKYNASFEVCDTGTEYYSNNVPCVHFSSQYDQTGLILVRDGSQLELPDYITSNY